MDLRLLVLMISLTVLAIIGVDYANSQTETSANNIESVYTSQALLANCRLKVSREGANTRYVPSDKTKTEFLGFWPTTPGTVYLAAQTTESLAVTFRLFNGELQPSAYTYADPRLAKESNRLVGDSHCIDLGLVH